MKKRTEKVKRSTMPYLDTVSLIPDARHISDIITELYGQVTPGKNPAKPGSLRYRVMVNQGVHR